MSSVSSPVLPSLSDLNSLSCSQVSLLLARCLMTSDFTFFHDLLDAGTKADLASTMRSLFLAEERDGDVDTGLSPAEMAELMEYLRELKD